MNTRRAGRWPDLVQAFARLWRGIAGDTGVLMMLFGAPLLYSALYPLPYSREDVQQVPIAIVDQDRSSCRSNWSGS